MKTPRDNTRALCEEIIWWHNQLYGHDITLAQVRSKSRVAPIVACRADCMRRIRDVRKWSFPVIGKWFGGFDHSTVMHHAAKKNTTTVEIKNAKRLSLAELQSNRERYRWRQILLKTKRNREAVGTSSTEEHTHETA